MKSFRCDFLLHSNMPYYNVKSYEFSILKSNKSLVIWPFWNESNNSMAGEYKLQISTQTLSVLIMYVRNVPYSLQIHFIGIPTYIYKAS